MTKNTAGVFFDFIRTRVFNSTMLEHGSADNSAWVKEAPYAITVCDKQGIILAMNDRSRQAFADYGGAELIGTNLLDCHPEPSKSKLHDLLTNPRPQHLHHRKKRQEKDDISNSLVPKWGIRWPG